MVMQEIATKTLTFPFSIAHIFPLIFRYLMFVKQWFYRAHVTAGRVRLIICITWVSSVIFIPFRLAHWMITANGVDWEMYTLYYVTISDIMVGAVIAVVSYCYVSSYK